MWTLIFMGLAALTWLVELASGLQGSTGIGSGGRWLDRAALAFAALAAAQLLLGFLYQVIRRGGAAGRTVRTDLLRTILSAVVYIGAVFLYVYFGLGLDITGLIATSAALSLIVGLALQATLGNLFAGISIELEHVLRVGDYVRRGTLEGEVISLGWRSVHVRSDTGSILIVPNSSVTSDVLEVIPGERPYRHEIEFSVSTQQAPGLVIQLATRVLRSGVPGICEDSLGEVLLRGSQPEIGAYRYAARFDITAVTQREAIGSAVLERVWYEISRIDRGLTANDRVGGAAANLEASWCHVLERALSIVGADIQPQLLKTVRVRRYGRRERYRERGVSLIVEGSMSESRSATEAAAALKDVRALVAQSGSVEIHGRRLDFVSYHSLRTLGTMHVGPLADRLCDRIASVTDDPWLAFQAFALFIHDPAQRQGFLQHAPGESLRTMQTGTWLGMGPNPEQAVSRVYRAHESCTLLVWSRGDFQEALDGSSGADISQLAALLGASAGSGDLVAGSDLRG